MSRRGTVAGAIGILATTFGILVLLVPGVLTVGPGAWVSARVAAVDPLLVMVVAGVLMGGYLLVATKTGSADGPASVADSRFEQAVTHPPEGVTAEGQVLAASAIDADVAMALDFGGQSLRRIRSLLLESAVSIYAAETDTSTERAEAVVARGEWTDDETAAWFLAGDEGPQPPKAARLWLWLRPEHERQRRIERTLTAIERLRDES